MIQLNEKTTVPLWSIIAFIPTFIGAAFWISLIAYKVETNQKDIADLKIRDKIQSEEITRIKDSTLDLLNKIQVDIAVIKAQVGKVNKWTT